jgi:hypothetical protein
VHAQELRKDVKKLQQIVVTALARIDRQMLQKMTGK